MPGMTPFPGPRQTARRLLRRRFSIGVAVGLLAAAAAAADTGLPPEVAAALQRARVPPEALVAVVQEVGGGRVALSAQAQMPVNPASLAKLLTTFAALDQLGPAWTWTTPVWLTGTLRAGVLDGDLVIKGSGDPKLVLERVWLLLRRVQQLGVREIGGDIVLDSSAFAPPNGAPADFDGERLRAYNVQADALLLNYKSVSYSFVPDAARGVALVIAEPRLPEAPETTLALASGPCGEWRAALQPSFEPPRVRFAGSYPAGCGEQTWVTAESRPASYNARLVESMWREIGGRLVGRARDGLAPAGTRPSFELKSPALSEIVRDINKFSNNVMAQQLFLTLAALQDPARPASAEAARDGLARWLAARLGDTDTVIDNGSGLSRDNRITAQTLARLLQAAWTSPVMPELLASLPVSGLDGTLRRSRASPGRAHLKTGSLRDVAGIAGYVLSDSGRRYVLVAIVNHANANAARPALDALIGWALRDAPAR